MSIMIKYYQSSGLTCIKLSGNCVFSTKRLPREEEAGRFRSLYGDLNCFPGRREKSKVAFRSSRCCFLAAISDRNLWKFFLSSCILCSMLLLSKWPLSVILLLAVPNLLCLMSSAAKLVDLAICSALVTNWATNLSLERNLDSRRRCFCWRFWTWAF